MRLNERVALVVGAAGHLGRAISQALMIFAQHKRLIELEKRLDETQK
jgi:NAD(P)-dependent dehydrogenase (short-subunit alcohol dehydrogenase family)